jgi:hypothetical protein
MTGREEGGANSIAVPPTLVCVFTVGTLRDTDHGVRYELHVVVYWGHGPTGIGNHGVGLWAVYALLTI